MTTVKNIKRTEYPIPQDIIDIFKNIGNLLPTDTPVDLSFELHNSTVEIANSIRCCINYDLDVKYLDFDNINTDDEFIIIHEIRKRLHGIPIKQVQVQCGLDVYNDTDDIIPVYTSSIDSKEKICSGTNILTYLRPNKRLTIPDIHTKTGNGNQSTLYTFPGLVKYKCVTPTRWDIVIPRQKFIEPIEIVRMGLRSLQKRLDAIYPEVKDKKTSSQSPIVDISYLNGSANYKIYNESIIIGNLISKYGYLADPTIEFIACSKKHSSYNYITLEIKHQDPCSIITAGIVSAKKELLNIYNAFEN